MRGNWPNHKGLLSAGLILAGALTLAGCGSTSTKPAPSSTTAITVENAWARPASGSAGGMTSAAYFTLQHSGGEADALISVSTDVAGKAELHETVAMDGNTSGMDHSMHSSRGSGVMKMQAVQKVPVPAGGSVEFKPGGLHVMLMDLKRDLKNGDRFKLTLNFEKGGQQTVEVTVKQQ